MKQIILALILVLSVFNTTIGQSAARAEENTTTTTETTSTTTGSQSGQMTYDDCPNRQAPSSMFGSRSGRSVDFLTLTRNYYTKKNPRPKRVYRVVGRYDEANEYFTELDSTHQVEFKNVLHPTWTLERFAGSQAAIYRTFSKIKK